uniref:Uncharacterized protein n=1 Tax=Oncorhynchus tshawytscha TaxID=74940 RepID=A0A8C8CMK3_ONCTS
WPLYHKGLIGGMEDTERSNAELSKQKVDLQSLPTRAYLDLWCSLTHNPIMFLAAHLLQNHSQYEDCI